MSSPAAYSPLLYKQRYEHLPVPLANGNTVTVSVHHYVNAAPSLLGLKGNNYNPSARDAFLAKLKKPGVNMQLRVDSGDGPQPVDKSVLNDIELFARYVFAGKGAPEHCQIVLQLADHWNLAPSGLPAYADAALGLDCNGFVGNYLWHIAGNHPHPWSNMGQNDTDGPDTGISGYFDHRRKISRWDAMKPGRCYILGRTDAIGNVIDKVSATGDFAHITITEPGRFGHSRLNALPYTLDESPLTWGFRPNHLRTRSSPGPLGRSLSLGDSSLGGIYVVESTLSAKQPGLSANWYWLMGTMKHHVPGVFDLYRESMALHQRLWFQIAEVG